MSARPYLASEDSALLREAVKGRRGGSCLEIGAGNGGCLAELAKEHRLSVGSDITKPMMRDWRDAGADYVISDRAGCFRGETFDLVAFNPPYVASEAVVDPTVDAGPEGGVPLAFLREALRVVKRTGAVVMLLLEEDVGRARTECERGGFRLACLGSRRLFFETLVVCEAKASGIWEGPRLD